MTDSKGGAPEGFEAHNPSGKKGKGPTMKERLIAERRAAEEAAEAAAKKAANAPSAAKPASKPAAKPVSRPKAAAKPVVKPVTKRPARPAQAAAASEGEEGAEEARPARASRPSARSGGARRSSSARSGSSRRKRGEEDETASEGEERGSRRRGGAKKKEKNMMAPALGGVALLALGGIAFWQLNKGDDAKAAPKDETSQEDLDAAAKAEADAQAEKDAQAKADQEAADAATAEEKEAKAKEDAAKAAAAAKEAEDPTKAPRNKKGLQKLLESVDDSLYDVDDPAEIKLSDLAPFEQPEGCSAEMWTEAVEKAATMADIDAGAAGKRAALSLESDFGKFAMPAIVNEMTKIDYSTIDGRDTGDFMQRTLQNLLQGLNVGWQYDMENNPNKTTIANRRAVVKWHGLAKRVLDEEDYWENMLSKTEAGKRALAEEKEKLSGAKDKAEDAVDDAVDDLLDMDD